MELNRKPRILDMANTLVTLIVGIVKVLFPTLWQRSRIHRKTVILHREMTAATLHINTGLVMTTVTKRKFVGSRTNSQCQELVSETHTHDRANLRTLLLSLRADKCPDVLHRFSGLHRIARSITQEKTIELQLGKVIIPGHDVDTTATFEKGAQLVEFHAAVDGQHGDIRILGAVETRLGTRHFGHQVALVRVLGYHLGGRCVFVQHTAEQRSIVTNLFDDGARIHMTDRRHVVLLEPGSQGLDCIPVTERIRVIGHDQASHMDTRGLKVLQDAKLVRFNRRDAIVSDVWIGQHKNLTSVRRIGERLDVAHHTCLEDTLSTSTDGSAKRATFVGETIGQMEGTFR
mmetsp:Transcript_42298/g.106708  ORF Transcript_42298/g.106708 Transcript_42298/m.106708 type:complete len:345 (-) Transcript_42298:323-1357(-)